MEIFIFNKDIYSNFSDEILENFQHKNFSNPEKKKTHCVAYLMLDSVLKDIYGIENREIEFVCGKPMLKTKEKFFSVSHSDEYVVLAVSNYNCGVDIEKIKPRNYEKISARMKFDSTSLVDFYKNWTDYEACYKLDSLKQSAKNFLFGFYMISAVSENSSEVYNLYYDIEKEKKCKF